MAVVNHALLQALRTAFHAEFKKGFDATESHYLKIASVIPSTTTSNTYGWIGDMPSMIKWVGDRVIKNFKEHGYTITNEDFEATLGVKRNLIEDDNLGMYSTLFQDLGFTAKEHPDELCFGLLKDGETELCYDGQNFFDAEHPVYANNDQTGASTLVSNITDGVEVPFYLMNTSRPLKPILFQQRKKPEFVAMINKDDEDVFMRKQFRFGVDSRDNAGFGFWQMAHKSKAGLTADNFNAAFKKMTSIKRDGGKPLQNSPTLLVVPPYYREQALEIVKAERGAAGATNINRNAVEVLVSPWVA